MDSKYTRDFEIPCYMTDSGYRLRPSSFMDLAQVMAMDGCRSLGCGYDTLAVEHKAWVLYRMHFEFLRPVLWQEKVSMETWHRGLQGVQFLRDCVLMGGDGQEAVLCTSSWIVLDTSSRTFVRNEDLPSCISADAQCDDAIFDVGDLKVVMPHDAEAKSQPEHVVSYSDIDFVGHTNNARYVVWAMDAIDPKFVSKHPVREVTVNFNHETRLGDRVQMRVFETSEDGARTFYVDGSVDGRQAFAVRLMF